jgi:mannose-6-phosphate isomerase-like protein (cupin superfamily)
MEGLRFKALSQGGRRIRLVEYTEAMEPHWCENGHIGVILDGTFEIEFADEAIVFEEGSGVFIPSGHAHRHRARVLEGPVHALFVEEA